MDHAEEARTDEHFEALRWLCSVSAPTGSEDELIERLSERWGGERDRVGNLLVHLGGHGPRTLVHAHADQVGYVVVSITDDGFLMLDTAQGMRGSTPEQRWPVGSDVRIGTRQGAWHLGVVAAASGHVTRWAPDDATGLSWRGFWVELGVADRQAVLDCGIHIGSPVVFEPRLRRLGPHRVACCAMDDRVGLCVLDALHRRMNADKLSVELWLAVTVQEEGGMHGAFALASAERFDQVIGLEVGLVGDAPGIERSAHPGRLGDGPMIVHKDGTMTYNRGLGRRLFEAAARCGIHAQDAAFAAFASDGMGFLDNGSPAALVAVPTRYTHTSFEMVDLRDLAATVQLLIAFIS